MKYIFFFVFAIFLSTAPHSVYANADLDVSHLKTKAAHGDIAAEYILAMKLISGKDNKKDPAAAMQHLVNSASHGYAKAQYRLATLYRNGLYLEKSETDALKWYRKAAMQGHAKAQYEIATLYSLYKKSKARQIEAYAWLEVITKRGHPHSEQLRDKVGQSLRKYEIEKAQSMARDYFQAYVIEPAEKRKMEQQEKEKNTNTGIQE